MKKKTVGEELIQGLEEALSFSKGEIKLKTYKRVIPAAAPEYTASKVKKLRKLFGATQEEFSQILNVDLSTIRAWEQGQRNPNKSANRLMEILSKEPTILESLVS